MATSVAPAARRKIAQLVVLLLALPPALSDDCSIESLSPVAGPTSGGTHVNVTGTDLGDGPTWECSFGSAVEAAADVLCAALRYVTARTPSLHSWLTSSKQPYSCVCFTLFGFSVRSPAASYRRTSRRWWYAIIND